jgi:hypothetical protein
MTILPQTTTPPSLNFSSAKLASGYAPAYGWQLRAITVGKYGAQVELFNPRCASLKLQGGIAVAWIDMFGGDHE